jgi:hypothetical protein
MNNRNEAKTSQEPNTANNEESSSHHSDAEFSTNFAINLLKQHLVIEHDANNCYVLGYN